MNLYNLTRDISTFVDLGSWNGNTLKGDGCIGPNCGRRGLLDLTGDITVMRLQDMMIAPPKSKENPKPKLSIPEGPARDPCAPRNCGINPAAWPCTPSYCRAKEQLKDLTRDITTASKK